jgi:hypothetical protein
MPPGAPPNRLPARPAAPPRQTGPGNPGTRPGNPGDPGTRSATRAPGRATPGRYPPGGATPGGAQTDGRRSTVPGLSWLPEWLASPARELVGVASLVAVALVPGAAMAASAITVASGAYCSFGSFCLYSGPNFDGARAQYDTDRLFCQDGEPALDLRGVLPGGAHSVVNNTRGSARGIGVKIYGAPDHLVITTVSPGSELRGLDDGVASRMATLCAYPTQQ